MDRIWYPHYSPGVPKDINPDEFVSLNDLFEQSCHQHSTKTAFSNLGVSLSYQALEEKSRYFASYLQKTLKLQKGDRVAIMMPNLLQYPVALYGILRAGLVVVNINPLYTAVELTHSLRDSGAKAIIVLANFAHTLEKSLPDVELEHILITELADLMGGLKKPLINFVVKHIKRLVPPYCLPQSETFSRALRQGEQLAYDKPLLDHSDLAFLQYTGGTTGRPKAAMLSHRNMIANILQCRVWIQGSNQDFNDVVLAALPLYHIFSLTVCCMTFMTLGAECLLITNPRDMSGFIKTLSKHPVSVFVGLNTLFIGMMNHPSFSHINFSRLRLTVAGGMAMQLSVADDWLKKTGVPVLQGYGLTESSPVVSINPIHQTENNNSIGIPVPSTDIEIRNEAGEIVSTGEAGELCVKGPQVMSSYWRQAAETAQVIKDDWLLTGDIATMDEQGYLYIVDRKKDMILVSGFNVYPNEVEAVLSQHPDIQEVAVIGVPYEKTGEAVKAFVIRKSALLTEDAIKQFAKSSLTAYKIPKFIEFCEELPKSNVGKILRRKLR
jgi:long-chain acyl-CoA synthetase